MLYQLIYVSRAVDAMSAADVKTILGRAQRNNARLGISGALMLHGRHFLQVLEGDPAQVCKLYQRILADALHDQVVQIGFSEIDRRHFAAWSMGLLAATDANREIFQQHLGDALLDPLALDATRARHLFDLVHDNVRWLQ